MSRKETKELRKNAKSGTMSDEMWKRQQEQSAKGSDMTITDDIDEIVEEIDEVLSKKELDEGNNPLLENYRKIVAKKDKETI
jgi:uncharacterized protein with von Willebrand factor type A (vWA) domain